MTRPNPTELGLLGGWDKRRAHVIRRDGRCQKCRTTKHLTVHHIRPRTDFGAEVERNLVTLCRTCHDWAEMRLDQGALSWEELVRPPSPSQDGRRRIWYQDEQGRICAQIVDDVD